MPTDHVLNLWKRDLGTIPDEVWSTPDISVLILADNALEVVSPRIGDLRHLRTLDLGHNRLTKLPLELGHLVSLGDFLYVHDNQLDALPESLGRLQKLKYLNISENRFSTFPEAICDMRGLVELRATDNQLTELPTSIGKLSQLRELHIRNNGLRTLPPTISELSALRQIDLRGNPIETLPDSMRSMPRLEKIDLRWIETLSLPTWLHQLQERGCLVYR